MEKHIFILSSTDLRHTKSSKETISCHKKFESAIKAAKFWAKIYKEPLSKDDLNNLHLISQTQGRDTNLIIETFELRP
jgi:hypothetical protein